MNCDHPSQDRHSEVRPVSHDQYSWPSQNSSGPHSSEESQRFIAVARIANRKTSALIVSFFLTDNNVVNKRYIFSLSRILSGKMPDKILFGLQNFSIAIK